LNSNEKVRQKYLEDIEKYVFPMITKDLPQMKDYFIELSSDCLKRGYFGNEPETIKT